MLLMMMMIIMMMMMISAVIYDSLLCYFRSCPIYFYSTDKKFLITSDFLFCLQSILSDVLRFQIFLFFLLIKNFYLFLSNLGLRILVIPDHSGTSYFKSTDFSARYTSLLHCPISDLVSWFNLCPVLNKHKFKLQTNEHWLNLTLNLFTWYGNIA